MCNYSFKIFNIYKKVLISAIYGAILAWQKFTNDALK